MSAEEQLWKAAAEGDAATLKMLLTGGAVDINAKSPMDGSTPLIAAARAGHTACVKALAWTPGINLAATDEYGRQALHVAAAYCRPDTLKALLDAGADVDARDEDRHTAAHLAAAHDGTDCLGLLLEAGADVTSRDGEGQQPLHAALDSPSPLCVAFLIAAGAPVDAGLRQAVEALPERLRQLEAARAGLGKVR